MRYGRRLNVLGQHFASQLVHSGLRYVTQVVIHFRHNSISPEHGLILARAFVYSKTTRTRSAYVQRTLTAKRFADAMTISAPSVLFPLINPDLRIAHAYIFSFVQKRKDVAGLSLEIGFELPDTMSFSKHLISYIH